MRGRRQSRIANNQFFPNETGADPIEKYPEIAPIVDLGVPARVLLRFPYSLMYVAQPEGFAVIVGNRFRELRIGGIVEARFHLRGRPSNLAKSSSEAIDFDVPAFSCW
jgi:hypothetical protein